MDYSSDIMKKMEQMGVRLEKDYISKNICSGPAVPVFSGTKSQQELDLKMLREELEDLKTLVSTLVPKIEKIADDQEQYSRSNCLIVHGIKNTSKRGEYLL